MHVRKFEADTLDEALKNIKRELGPDAIILKTITNKGLKGALSKKKKIEITAAISQKNYLKKARVDKVLDEGQKKNFYTNKASHISNMIDEYNHNPSLQNNYGNIAKGRSANINQHKKSQSKLDDFLKGAETSNTPTEKKLPVKNESSNITEVSQSFDLHDRQELMEQRNKIDELSIRITELSKSIDRIEEKAPIGISHIHNLLRSFSIDPSYIKNMINKIIRELPTEKQQEQEAVVEFTM
ncbi:MAG: hypothetical protein OXB84_08890, partial [Halobacteriovoraceae bacterium]|nr:hypothetical protein [Halobacteriovoraceae bacterium]